MVIDCGYIDRYKTPRRFMVLGVDLFSKRVRTGFINNLTSAKVTRIVEPWLRGSRYRVVLTDNGSEFIGHEFQSMISGLGGRVKHIYASPKFANKTSVAEIYIRRWKEKFSLIKAEKKITNPLQQLNAATKLLNINPKADGSLMTPSEIEEDPGEATYRRMMTRWRESDGPPKEPRFRVKDLVYLRHPDTDKLNFKSGDRLIDGHRYVVTGVIRTEPLASYHIRLVDFPYTQLASSFDESRLIAAKDL